MSVMLGRNSRIKLGTATIAKMTSMSVTFGQETIDISHFGSTWAKMARGLRNWSASISGFYDKSDATQKTLVDAAEAGDTLTDIRFYLDTTAHYKIDVVTDSEAEAIIESFVVTSDNNNVVAFDMTLTGVGPLIYSDS